MNKTCCYLLIIILIVGLVFMIDYLKISKELSLLRMQQENIVTKSESVTSSDYPEQDISNPKDFRDILTKFLEEQNHRLNTQTEDYQETRFIPDLRPVSTVAVTSQIFSEKHPGIDLAAPRGTEVKATASGRVEAYKDDEYFGNLLVLEHFNGYYTYYGHLDQLLAVSGRFAEKGDVIGTVGSTGFSTGPHLHYSIQKDGKFMDPVILMKKINYE
jgi:murein DD-endopeptidase MepM/ murein hydrolase activator NlpD